MTLHEQFCNILKTWRGDRSHSEAADKLNMSRATYSDLERGRRPQNLTTVQKVLDAMGLEVALTAKRKRRKKGLDT